jgi:hypothetical protein
MSQPKRASKRKSKAVPVLGAAGLGAAGLLSFAGSASASVATPTADVSNTQNLLANHEIVLGEEELSDVSLGTFYVFDKENDAPQSRIQLARGGGCGCGHGGCGHGCGGHGCGGARGCGCGHGGCGRGCRCGRGCGCGLGGCGCWGGCGCGCCWSWGGCGLC